MLLAHHTAKLKEPRPNQGWKDQDFKIWQTLIQPAQQGERLVKEGYVFLKKDECAQDEGKLIVHWDLLCTPDDDFNLPAYEVEIAQVFYENQMVDYPFDWIGATGTHGDNQRAFEAMLKEDLLNEFTNSLFLFI